MLQILKKTQKNEVFKVIKKGGLVPDDFFWEEVESSFKRDMIVSKLNHKRSEYFFVFDQDSYLKFRNIFSPAVQRNYTEEQVDEWESVISLVGLWAYLLKEEINSPDLWSISSSNKEIISYDIEKDQNNSFTQTSIQLIDSKLNELKNYTIQIANLGDKEIAFLEARISYLKNASQRVNKKDWKLIFIGVLFNIIVGLGLQSDYADEILSFANQLFRELYQHLLN
ncbi:MAG: hypothetical protein ABJI69_02165 [Balneola sp.]|jgi:hypothetical protein